MGFSDGYAVPGSKGEKVVPVYPVLPSGEPESRQVALFNPAQDGYFADTAMSGDDTGGEIFRVGLGSVYAHFLPSLDRISISRFGTLFTRLTMLTKIPPIL
jgi:hypothetical protein